MFIEPGFPCQALRGYFPLAVNEVDIDPLLCGQWVLPLSHHFPHFPQ